MFSLVDIASWKVRLRMEILGGCMKLIWVIRKAFCMMWTKPDCYWTFQFNLLFSLAYFLVFSLCYLYSLTFTRLSKFNKLCKLSFSNSSDLYKFYQNGSMFQYFLRSLSMSLLASLLFTATCKFSVVLKRFYMAATLSWRMLYMSKLFGWPISIEGKLSRSMIVNVTFHEPKNHHGMAPKDSCY